MVDLKGPNREVLDSVKPINIIGDIRTELTTLEQFYPALMANFEYINLKDELLGYESSRDDVDQKTLEVFYDKLILFLNTAELDNNVVRFGNRQERKRPALDGFLPETFDEFIRKISLEKQAKDYVEDGVEAAAHALILGELPYGLTAVVPRFRDKVRATVFEDLVAAATGEILARELEEDQLLAILQLSEEDIVEELMDGDDISVGLAVLAVRREIESEYQTGVFQKTTLRDGVKPVSKKEISRLKDKDAGAYHLLRTMALSKPENPKETRLRLAARVARIMNF